MSGHTPAPWVVAHSFRGIYTSHPSPGPVQVCVAPEHFHEQWKANAALISAAPDMLEVLEELMVGGYVPIPEFEDKYAEGLGAKARAAIAKATGLSLHNDESRE